ncbi:hypothetical protein SISNIDRAFT_468354 [Sistotremastrum niveocremeum HHB9708]|uniref:Uncharacterized protein n=1 Tax=Sistotremastrum niveocremeum HHB9708 TaxID=1314777 RepID=A0A164RHN4_9AGAM|nr:hypothetical protein SISNIDRAFT_468354 [Sistotremastrum niveocremeum HHB9708]
MTSLALRSSTQVLDRAMRSIFERSKSGFPPKRQFGTLSALSNKVRMMSVDLLPIPGSFLLPDEQDPNGCPTCETQSSPDLLEDIIRKVNSEIPPNTSLPNMESAMEGIRASSSTSETPLKPCSSFYSAETTLLHCKCPIHGQLNLVLPDQARIAIVIAEHTKAIQAMTVMIRE